MNEKPAILFRQKNQNEEKNVTTRKDGRISLNLVTQLLGIAHDRALYGINKKTVPVDPDMRDFLIEPEHLTDLLHAMNNPLNSNEFKLRGIGNGRETVFLGSSGIKIVIRQRSNS